MERLEPKAPSEIRNYRFDWAAFLDEDTIATSVVDVTGATLASETHDDTSVTVKISGGTGGTVAKITNTITTAGGLQESELFTLTITAAAEPVSLQEAKAQLRLGDDTSEDALISSYIRSARAYVESESGFVFVQRQFTDQFSCWPRYILIGRRPIVSIDAINYQDTDGTPQALTSYRTSQDLQRLSPASTWPTLGCGGSVSVTYTAGFAEGANAEELELARQAILLLVGHWHLNRETATVDAVTPAEVPFAARALIDRFRTITI